MKTGKPRAYKRAEMFNRTAAQARKRPDVILSTLALRPGQAIADLGSGGGYFCFRFADAVGGQGRVYAIDVETDFLAFIRERAREKQIANVVTVPIPDVDRVLPLEALDWLFMRNVFHHLDGRAALLRGYRRFLKPSGRVAIVEHKPAFTIFDLRRPFGHYVKPEKIIMEMEEAGYRAAARHDTLPGYSFTIFGLRRT